MSVPEQHVGCSGKEQLSLNLGKKIKKNNKTPRGPGSGVEAICLNQLQVKRTGKIGGHENILYAINKLENDFILRDKNI